MIYKVGIGYDVHSLEMGKPFTLGGIKLNHSKVDYNNLVTILI